MEDEQLTVRIVPDGAGVGKMALGEWASSILCYT
jgi:hypothetical protein